MTTMLTTLIALMMSLLPVQTQNLPHAFPRDGAKQLIDNERVNVWEVIAEKGKPTAMHRHRYDMVAVELTGTAVFMAKGLTHVEEGTSTTPRRTIMVDLKDVVVSPLPNKTGFVEAFPREGTKKLIDNARVTVWDVGFTLGKPSVTHFHSKDVVVVYLHDAEMVSTTPDGKKTTSTSTAGQVKFNPRDRTHSELLVKGAQRVIAVELK
jgi:hypothetical protein